MTLAFVLAAVAVLGLLAVATAYGVARLEAAHPPAGQFFDIDGVHLHVVDLGAPNAAAKLSPAVVLIHGASGNLEDMRLALGDKLARNHRVILIDRPGHGWSTRPPGDAFASPARQAAIVATALDRLGVDRVIIAGHSWGGALASTFALDFPQRTAGLVLISAVTHPWPGGIAWYYNASSIPLVRTLLANTVAFPFGSLVIEAASRGVFAPAAVPADYVNRAAIKLVLRPTTFFNNARDVSLLKGFVAQQAPRYAGLCAPTVIITGDHDTTVSPDIHSRTIAKVLPNAKLIVLKDVGHMPHHAASDVVVAAIDELAANGGATQATAQRR
jgi:pimeloyl-ACP methyl ester carboxylesterase